MGEYDFIRAKARLAIDINGQLSFGLQIKPYPPDPGLSSAAAILYNRKHQKPTIPVNINLE